jgi:predicted amidohydrolase YtcJ
LEKAMDHLLQHGITSINDLSSSSTFSLYKKMSEERKLKLRIRSAFEIHEVEKLINEMKSFQNSDFFSIGVLKGMVDGALGSMTAKMYEPYENSNNTGIVVTNGTTLYNLGKLADDHNLQVVIHAIGDYGNHIVLNTFENIIKSNGEKDRRFRIEHAQQLKMKDLIRFKKLNVSASMQPYHLFEDSEYAISLIGDRWKDLFLFKSLLKEGVHLTFGADWPISPISPIEALQIAVTRKTNSFPNGFNLNETISIKEALRAYTSDAAYVSFMDDKIGKLKPNYFADMVILDQDILNINADEIKKTRILCTIVNGEIKFQNKK